ncbi:hypothetical protein [Massilia arenae]|uniref:Uncharacterized protein n=1 Tax=Massilia arenae TaxID=2603288 RepID=A0A5C7G0H4_9BURK|nr:hypothetical protein [Massilia arenae]TXF97054.1 hypothetical protein FVD38_22505 [Massilia arenae]
MPREFSVTRRRIFLGVSATLIGGYSLSQGIFTKDNIFIGGKGCAFDKDVKLGNIAVSKSTLKARELVADICGCVALPANFTIIATDEPEISAYATLQKDKRYIIYDETFMKSASQYGNTNWSNVGIIAHEIGHHLCGHTLDNIGSRPPRELEADAFSGFVIGNLGGSLDEGRQFLLSLSSSGSETHPPRSERIDSFTAGWKKAKTKAQGNKDHLVFISHNQTATGTYARVISEFIKKGDYWKEHQHGKHIASFTEGARDDQAIYLFDASRSIWLRITTNTGAKVSSAGWSPGSRGAVPDAWRPMDPINWR